jgi:acyl carrier protein
LTTVVGIDEDQLRSELKNLIVEECDKNFAAEDISDDEPLMGGDLDLDSLDALQICVAVGKRYGVRIEGGAQARRALASISTLAAAIRAGQSH